MEYIKKLDYAKACEMEAELWDFSRANENEESRIEAVATVASVCYGKPPKDAKKLVERLWTESGGLPSSAFEFIRLPESNTEESLRNKPDMGTHEWWANGHEDGIVALADGHKRSIATFKLKVPIFIARQIQRHRSFSFQELSRRYTTDKQALIEWWFTDPEDTHSGANGLRGDLYNVAITAYKRLLKMGERPEVARSVLPTGLMTTFWMQGDILAWKNYFKLRLDLHAQYEHRKLAKAMLALLSAHQRGFWERVAPPGFYVI